MEIDDDEELNEKDLDINSGNLFECLYYNLINFIKSNQNNNKVFSDIQKYLISEIVDILESGCGELQEIFVVVDHHDRVLHGRCVEGSS